MQYRFYIYKQDISVTNFNKYDLTQYVLLRQITNNAQWSLKIDRDNDFLSVMRTTFNGSISVDGADFTALIALEGSQLQYCVQIQEYCNKAWREKWKGFFSYFDFKPDLDRCQLNFTPSIWDIYTPVYDQMDMERNVLTNDTGEDVFIAKFEYPFEEVLHIYTLGPGVQVPPPTWIEYWGYPAGNKYYLYSRIGTEEIIVTDNGAEIQHTVTDTYRRDFHLDPSNTPSGTWILDPQLPGPGEYSAGVYKWVRPYLDSAFTTPYIHNGDSYILYTLENQTDLVKGCVTLKSIIEYFCTFFNLTYVSDFLNNDPCPMGGPTLVLTMLQQISNLGGDPDSATKGLMKLKWLLTHIRDTFNAYWFIDSNGDFRIEHRKYFDQGLSYTSLTRAIELDLSLYPDNIRNLRRYEWSKPNLFRFERLEIPYSYNSDWIDSKIEYPQLSILGNAEKLVTVEWGTDIISMKAHVDDLPKQGWVLLNVNLVWIGGLGTHWVIKTVGAITGVSMQNARFSQANLMRDLWGWGRLLPTGNVNGVATTFGSYEKLRKQVELTIPQCCQDLDYNGIFKTPLGNGLIDSAEYEAKTGNLKISLKYE